jgi:predicted phage terminase large subunit-like protein
MFVVLDVVSIRARPHEVDQLIDRTAQQDGRAVRVGFWQDPGAAGKAEADRHVRRLAGWAVSTRIAALNKVAYAKATSSQAEKGNVKLLRGPWNDAYLSEHEGFPDGAHDDIVDAESLGVLEMTTHVDARPVYVSGL